MNFFTSDIHLGSEDIFKADNRPFKNAKTFGNYVVKNFNKQAKKGDTIYVIGDFIDYHYQENYDWHIAFKFIKKINADVVLIIGNNEERIIRKFFDNKFSEFKKYCINNGIKDVVKNITLEICGQQFYLTHKPKDCNYSMQNLFGHSHKAIGIYKSFGFNVFYDLHNFRLLTEKDIEHFLYMKATYWDKDEELKLV